MREEHDVEAIYKGVETSKSTKGKDPHKTYEDVAAGYIFSSPKSPQH